MPTLILHTEVKKVFDMCSLLYYFAKKKSIKRHWKKFKIYYYAVAFYFNQQFVGNNIKL